MNIQLGEIMETNMVKCGLCESEFQFGPQFFDGRSLPNYKIYICTECRGSNRDGLAPRYEKRFLLHLKKEGIVPPKRNKMGWFPL